LNVAISFYRKNVGKQAHSFALPEQVAQTQDAESIEKMQQLQLLEQFIQELKELDKALMLLYLEDKPHTEMAEILGITTTNVATKIGRIKEKLKQRFSTLNNA
jgi:RNA polymerase sigma-70 factor (ECF subfamily)